MISYVGRYFKYVDIYNIGQYQAYISTSNIRCHISQYKIYVSIGKICLYIQHISIYNINDIAF